MSDITLSAGIRQNLLSLQQTSADLTTTQEALSTGNKVNSASDNPSAYFTSQNLTNNANALSALLDQIGQGQQTINAATDGLTGITSLLQQALSTAQQAQQSSTGTLTYANITGTGSIGADTTQVTSSTFSTDGLTAATLSSTTASDTNIAGLSAGTASTTSAADTAIDAIDTDGDTLVFQVGSNAAVTATYGASADFTDSTSLADYLTTALNGKATVSDSDGNLTITSSAVGSSNDIATVTGTGASTAAFSAPTTGTAADTLVFQVGSNTAVTATKGTDFTDSTSLESYLTAQLGSDATVSDSGGNLSVTSNVVGTSVATVGGTGASGAGFSAPNASSAGSSLVLTDAGGANSTFYYVGSDASTANGTFSNLGELVNAINANTNTNSEITASSTGGGTTLTLANATDTTGSIKAGGTVGTALGFNSTAYNNNYNASLATAVNGNQTLTIQVGSDAAHTLTFGTGTGDISTLAGLQSTLNSFSDVTASVNGSGNLVLTPTSTSTITVGGSANGTVGNGTFQLATSTTPDATVVTPNSTRATLQANYNSLLTQIDQLAGDSSYNGVNLLNGDNLVVDFDPNGTSSLTIAGVNDSSTGLGLNQLNNNDFQDDTTISNIVTGINNAISTVQAQTETFGTNSGTITTRQTFENALINTLQTGASNLVAADQNEESADLLTEQTQQQLEISALSIANQANQSVLKLFG